MKTLISFFFVLFVAVMAVNAQEPVKAQAGTKVTISASGDLVAVQTVRAAEPAISTGQNFVLKSGDKLPVFKTKTGRLYVNRISKKSGAEYRQYLTMESDQAAK